MTAASPAFNDGAAVALPGARGAAQSGTAGGSVVADGKGQAGMAWDAFRRNRPAFIGLIVLTFMLCACIFLPFVLVSPTDLDYTILAASPPSAHHPLGTDAIGRDELSRLVSAGRISLLIGFMVAFISAGIGSVVGVCAGYFGGKVDGLLMWLVNMLMTIPTLPLLIALSALVATPGSRIGDALKSMPTQWRIILVLALLGWMGISRVVRSQVLTLRNQEFVEAAQALGADSRRVMFVHILPNSVSVIAVFTTLAVSGALLGESALSFLGVGVQPPTATWGNMLADARDLFTILQYWWLTWFPALAIFTTVLATNFVGDGVRDALDPKEQKR